MNLESLVSPFRVRRKLRGDAKLGPLHDGPCLRQQFYLENMVGWFVSELGSIFQSAVWLEVEGVPSTLVLV